MQIQGIRAKLWAIFATLLLLMGWVGFIGWQNTMELAKEAEGLYANQLQGTVALANSESALWKLRYGFPQFIVQPEKRSEILSQEPELYKAIDENLRKYATGELTLKEKAAFEKVQNIYQKYVAARPRWFELQQAGKTQEAAEYRAATTTPFGAQTVQEFSSLINLQREVGKNKHDDIEAKVRSLTTLLILTFILALLVALTMIVIVSQNILKPVVKSVNKIVYSSKEISTTIEWQESTISQQATAVNQTTTTMNELGVSSQHSAEQAEASAVAAHQALSLADGGTHSVEYTVKGIEILKEKVGKIAGQIMDLSEQTVQIEGISNLVAELANQTNMLALNAAVEAVRAGEHGKGFAVVAGEIRKLADESKIAAQKIKILVKEIQSAIGNTVMVTEEGTKTAEEGIRLAQGTNQVFTGVKDAIGKVFLNNQQISLNVNQQAFAIQQVLEAMKSINSGTHETTAGIARVKDSIILLNQTAKELQKLS
ncbi:MAG: methyl-accepting chemotaxis protein [Microcoleus sp. CSU_2_2]|nr:methyl-accepting chemotaxis protein [Microcoleus sp. SU_5_3]NJS09742.1 methyl-accepting chemotaxis protein [Microcoleus sp. CSU_2_2]